MAWNATISFTTGMLVTAAMLNTYLSADLDYLKGNAGPVTISDSLTANGSFTAASFITTTNTVNGSVVYAGTTALSASTGDLSANRGGTGYVYLGTSGHSLGFDGASYQLTASDLYINGQVAVRGATGLEKLIDAGNVNSGSLANASTNTVAVVFSKAFTAAPTVIVSLQQVSGSLNTSHLVSVTASAITSSGFTAGFNNQSGAANTIFATWIALGQG